jgi:hypothetical protein
VATALAWGLPRLPDPPALRPPPLPVIGALSAFGFSPKRRAATGQPQKPASSGRDSSQCATGWGLIRVH